MSRSFNKARNAGACWWGQRKERASRRYKPTMDINGFVIKGGKAPGGAPLPPVKSQKSPPSRFDSQP